MENLSWLLDSDPCIRWQTLRDLTDASPEAIASARARVPREGLGAEILAAQESDGSWRCANAPVWLSTLFTFLLLRSTGADHRDPAIDSAVGRLETSLRWNDLGGRWNLRPAELGGNPFFVGEVEPCINGGVLALGASFGRPNESLANRLVDEQLEDGGWNCEAPKSRRSSFHTTICVLEGLLEYERAGRGSEAVARARNRAENYLLDRGMFRSLRTGEIVNKRWLRFAYPPFWHYDVLRGLDYLRNAGVKPDHRVAGAIEVVIERRHQNGRWPLNLIHPEFIPLQMEASVGSASRWNTLRALRVLRRAGSAGC